MTRSRNESIDGDVLHHEMRKRIFEHISNNPGITFNMIRSAFRMNEGTLNYHLNSLRKGELIEVRKRKNERIYLPRDIGSANIRDLKKRQTMVLRMIIDGPGITLGQISERSGSSKREITTILTRLKKKRLIRCEKEGAHYGYHAITEEDLRNEVLLILIDKYADGEITFSRLMDLKNKLSE